MRSKTVLLSVVAAGLFVAAAPILSADIIQDLTINISSCTSCNSNFFVGYPQDQHYQIAPGHGSADFSSLGLPWTFSFTTGLPTWWSVGGYAYGLAFGQGGVFNMTGPYGLSFAGIIDYGASDHGLGHAMISVTFSGYWSNGMSAEGSISQTYDAWNMQPVYTASLNTSPTSSPVPEPGCLLLLGSSLLIAWKCRR